MGCGQEASLAKGTATPIQHFSAVCCTFSQGAPSYYTCIATVAVCTSSQLPAGCCTGFGRQQKSCARAVLPAGLSGFEEDPTVLTSVPRCRVSHSAVVADGSPALDWGGTGSTVEDVTQHETAKGHVQSLTPKPSQMLTRSVSHWVLLAPG